MSDGINIVMLVGNVGADAELKFTPGGQPYMKVRLCTNKSWKDKETKQRKSKSQWHQCIMWGTRAEGLAEHIRKGDQLGVRGEIEYNEYEDRDGNKRWSTQIVLQDVTLMGSGKKKEREDGDEERDRERPKTTGSGRDRARAAPPRNDDPPPDDEHEGGGGFGGDDDIPF